MLCNVDSMFNGVLILFGLFHEVMVVTSDFFFFFCLAVHLEEQHRKKAFRTRTQLWSVDLPGHVSFTCG